VARPRRGKFKRRFWGEYSLVEVPTTLDGKPAILAMQLLGPTTRTMDESSPNALVLDGFVKPGELANSVSDNSGDHDHAVTRPTGRERSSELRRRHG
jgi:hypothetical protein